MGSKLLNRMNIRQRFALVLFLGVLVPVIVLCAWMLRSWKQQLVDQQRSALAEQLNQIYTDVEQVSELCSLSAQAFQSNRRLQEHLQDLQAGRSVTTAELYDFYKNDITSLQNIVSVNPYLYRIRVYSVCSQIDEVYPVLFGSDRLESIGWEQPFPDAGQWWLDYTDNMFGAGAEHRMALVQPMRGLSGQINAMLEVSAEMPRVFPLLFDGGSACLLTRQGQRIGAPALLEQREWLEQQFDANTEIALQQLDGKPVLLGTLYLEQLDAVYAQVMDLSAIYRQMAWMQLTATVLMLVLSVVLSWAVRWLVHGMLRQLGYVVEGVRLFSQGDLEVEIPVEGKDEIAQFSVQINELLASIRQLIHQNIEKEVMVKNTQIRALQNQINAHFLYNVLEAIKMMAEIDEKYAIADAVNSLGRLLRYTMKWTRRTVALHEELDHIDNYIALVNLRYDGQIFLERQVPQELLMQEIPKLSLQPIVENAVVHGGSHEIDRTIHILVRQQGGTVFIAVRNEGEPMSEQALEHLRRSIQGIEQTRSTGGNGIGLKNVQDRIHMTFGREYGITVDSRSGDGTTVTVTVPLGKIGQGEGT